MHSGSRGQPVGIDRPLRERGEEAEPVADAGEQHGHTPPRIGRELESELFRGGRHGGTLPHGG
jgi:hypothetical protein